MQAIAGSAAPANRTRQPHCHTAATRCPFWIAQPESSGHLTWLTVETAHRLDSWHAAHPASHRYADPGRRRSGDDRRGPPGTDHRVVAGNAGRREQRAAAPERVVARRAAQLDRARGPSRVTEV